MSVAGALLAACGGDEEEAAPPAEGASGQRTPPADTAAAEEPPAEEPSGEPVTGGQLVGYDRDFTRMDTVRVNWADPAYVALYEFTVVRDADGAYQPALVDSWEISGHCSRGPSRFARG